MARTELAWVAFGLLIATVAGRAAPDDRLPVYDGKTVAEWVRNCGSRTPTPAATRPTRLGRLGPKAAEAVGPLDRRPGRQG